MECPKYFYFRVKPNRHGTVIEIEDASDADVVEVVRCKDCRHWGETNFIHKPAGWCSLKQESAHPDYFCGSAKTRRQGVDCDLCGEEEDDRSDK